MPQPNRREFNQCFFEGFARITVLQTVRLSTPVVLEEYTNKEPNPRKIGRSLLVVAKLYHV
jgi:hypothetical protein